MAIKRDDFPLPDVDDVLSAPYFEGAARGELVIPRCDACGAYVWYPADVCPTDGGALTDGGACFAGWANAGATATMVRTNESRSVMARDQSTRRATIPVAQPPDSKRQLSGGLTHDSHET